MKFLNVGDVLKIGIFAFIFVYFSNSLLKKFEPKFTTHTA